MLPLKNRIKKRKDFEDVFKRGRVIKGSFFLAKIKENNLAFPRFAFVVPAKFEKKATKRNRTKRVFREATRSLLSLMKRNVDAVFVIKNEGEIDFTETKAEIKKVLAKEKII